MVRGVDAAKQTQWRRRLQRFEKSDLTVGEFCLDEKVSAAAFYYWKKRLAKSGVDQDVRDMPGRQAGFAAVRVIGSAGVTVVFPGGARVEIPAGDLNSLRLVVDALARVEAQRAGESIC